MEVAVDREQPVAEQRHKLDEVAFAPDEVAGVRDEHVVVRLRPDHEDHGDVQAAQREDRPVALVGVQQQRERIVGDAAGALRAQVHVAGREGHRRTTLRAQVLDQQRQGVEFQFRRPLSAIGDSHGKPYRMVSAPPSAGRARAA